MLLRSLSNDGVAKNRIVRDRYVFDGTDQW